MSVSCSQFYWRGLTADKLERESGPISAGKDACLIAEELGRVAIGARSQVLP